MQKIVPHLWFDTQAVEATKWYATLFPDSKVTQVHTISGTPSGDCDIVSFTLCNLECMAISAGPYFKCNPSISFFVTCKEKSKLEKLWSELSAGGSVLMELAKYPWAEQYGWLQDKYGVSWQLGTSDEHQETQMVITPAFLFTQKVAGKTVEAMEFYSSVFPDSKVLMSVPYEEGDGDQVGFIKYSESLLCGQKFIAMDSSLDHQFTFNEAVSLVVRCETQEEIDHYWSKLSAVPEAEQCGWLKDKFGVSWQIVPTAMDEMMGKGTPEQQERLTKSFLAMKKFDIAQLKKSWEG